VIENESHHWQRNERLPGFAAAVSSINVRRVYEATQRRMGELSMGQIRRDQEHANDKTRLGLVNLGRRVWVWLGRAEQGMARLGR